MAKPTKVVALENGHDGVAYRVAGEEFIVDMDDWRYQGVKWFQPADVPVPPKPDPKTVRPPGAGPVKGSKAGAAPIPGAEPGSGGGQNGDF